MLECSSGLLHGLVGVAVAFDDSGFDSTGTVTDAAFGDLGEERQAVGGELFWRDATSRQVGPGGE